ncbi:hypothetical protein ACI65C_013131 [Semiaphis heraclei]
MPTVVVTARSRICVWAVPDHPGGPACRGRSCRGTTCPVGAVVVALVSRLGVLVTGTSAGRIVGRRTRVSCFRRATRPRVARPSGFDDGGRLLQSCCAVLFTECRRRADTFTLNKLECSKQAQIWRGGFTAVSSKGPEYWSHGIRNKTSVPRISALRGRAKSPSGAFPCAGRRAAGASRPRVPPGRFSGPEVMINRDGRGHSYRDVRGEILGSSRDELTRKHLPSTFSYDQERKLEVRRRSDTALVLTVNDAS